MPRGYRRSPSPYRDQYRRKRRWEYSPPRRRDSPYSRRPYSRDSRERYSRRRSRSRSRSRHRSPDFRRRERSRSRSTPPRVTSRIREEGDTGISEAFERAMSAARKAEMALSARDGTIGSKLEGPISIQPAFSLPLNPISSTYMEAPSSTTLLGAATREPSTREANEISPFNIKEGTNIALSSRFERLEYLSGNAVELQKCLNSSKVSLEDISVVIERNLPIPQGNVTVRMSFLAELDVFVLPRGVKEGEQCIFDRPEIKAFNHDMNIDDDGYVETRKVVVRREMKSAYNRPHDPQSSPPARESQDSRDPRHHPQPRFDVDRDRGRGKGRGRGRGRVSRQRGGLSSRDDHCLPRPRSPESRSQRRQETEAMDDNREGRLPDFSLRPNKGYVQPDMRNPADIPKHGSYFLHDDREDFEMERGRGRGYRGSRRRAGRFSRFSIDRRTPRSRSNLRYPARNFWGARGGNGNRDRSPKGMDLDRWKHDKFEEVQDEEPKMVEDSKKAAS